MHESVQISFGQRGDSPQEVSDRLIYFDKKRDSLKCVFKDDPVTICNVNTSGTSEHPSAYCFDFSAQLQLVHSLVHCCNQLEVKNMSSTVELEQVLKY